MQAILVNVVTGDVLDSRPVTTQAGIDALNDEAQHETEGELSWVSLYELGKLHSHELCVAFGGFNHDTVSPRR